MKVSVRKISEITGFSPATVSNALNYKKGVNAETSAKIFKVAQDLGYFEENHIRKIKFVMFKRDGAVVEDSPFFIQLISGVEQECRACGMEMQMCNLDKRDPGYQEQAKWIMNDKASAVILLGTEMVDADIDLIRGMTCPFIVIDYWKEDMSFDAMLINNADSARMATEYLIANGHKEIGYLRGDFRIKPFRSRFAGYQTALQKAGLPLNKDYIFTMATFSSISYPPLTTLRVPKQEMGRAVVRRLRDILKDNDGIKIKMQMCTQFIERESVKKI